MPTYTNAQVNEILARHAALTGLIRGAAKRGEDTASLKFEQRTLAASIKVIKNEAALGAYDVK